MPESMSIERKKMMKAFGAELILTPKEEDMQGTMNKYNQLVKKFPSAWLPKQFSNPDNITAHEQGGREILSQLPKKIDAFVAGIGTGGTLLGIAKALKKTNPKIKIIGIEPEESAVLSGKKPNIHKIQGIGEGFIPELVEKNRKMIDEIITIKSTDAISMKNKLAKEYGLLIGISSGANILASRKVNKKYETVVSVLPDRGERYMS